jgi:hypothetical protein
MLILQAALQLQLASIDNGSNSGNNLTTNFIGSSIVASKLTVIESKTNLTSDEDETKKVRKNWFTSPLLVGNLFALLTNIFFVPHKPPGLASKTSNKFNAVSYEDVDEGHNNRSRRSPTSKDSVDDLHESEAESSSYYGNRVQDQAVNSYDTGDQYGILDLNYVVNVNGQHGGLSDLKYEPWNIDCNEYGKDENFLYNSGWITGIW